MDATKATYADYIQKPTPFSSVQILTTSTDEILMNYEYDDMYRLGTSEFSVYQKTSTPTTTRYTDYKVSGDATSGTWIEYDDDFNILNLQRNGYDQSGDYSMDDLDYSYS